MSFSLECFEDGINAVRELQVAAGAVPCDTFPCVYCAEWEWQRTATEVAAMKKPAKGRMTPPPVRRVCSRHKPAWREDVYAPLGNQRRLGPRQAPIKVRKRAPAFCPHCGGGIKTR